MKKRDIIQLVKEAIKATTFYGNRHQRSSISGLPGVMNMEMHDFEKKYGDKIKPDNFKNNPNLQKGKTVLYGGERYEIIKNDGFILTLKSREGKTTTVNLGQFNQQGAIKEKNMKNNVKEVDTKTYVGVDSITAIKKDPRYGSLSGDTKMDIEKKLKGGGSVELEEYLNEEPNEGNAFAVARLKAIKTGEKKFKVKDRKSGKEKEFDVTNISDDDKKAAAELDETMHTNDVGKDDYVDDEGRMAKSQIYKMGKYAVKLHGMLDDMEQLPAWVQSKITKASDYMSMVYHYLDYEFARRDGNLMEHVDKYNKRATLMEGAMKKFFEMFDKGMTDEEVVQEYARRGTQIPETFVGKARKQYEGMKRMKLELEMSEKEYKNSASKMVNKAEEGMEPSMEEKKLSSGLSKN